MRRRQPAHTPPQRPPGAEGKGRHKGRKRDKQRHETDTRDAGRNGEGKEEARPKQGRRKTGKDWKAWESEDKNEARAHEDKTRFFLGFPVFSLSSLSLPKSRNTQKQEWKVESARCTSWSAAVGIEASAGNIREWKCFGAGGRWLAKASGNGQARVWMREQGAP
eukprot:363292-Chlamydomonas_euryale.AAC.8